MTQQEAHAVLQLPGRYSSSDVDTAYHRLLADLSRKNLVAVGAAARHKAAIAMGKLKEARRVLRSGHPPASRQPAPKRKPRTRTKVKARSPKRPARKQPVRTHASHARPSSPPRAPATPPVTRSAPRRAAPVAPPVSGPSPIRVPQSAVQRAFRAAIAVVAVMLIIQLSRLADSPAGKGADGPTRVTLGHGKFEATVPAPARAESSAPVTHRQPVAKEPAATAVPAAKAYVVVRTHPSCEVWIGGRHVGYAPYRRGERTELPPGTHYLILKRDGHRPVRAKMHVKSGETREIRYWFATGELERR